MSVESLALHEQGYEVLEKAFGPGVWELAVRMSSDDMAEQQSETLFRCRLDDESEAAFSAAAKHMLQAVCDFMNVGGTSADLRDVARIFQPLPDLVPGGRLLDFQVTPDGVLSAYQLDDGRVMELVRGPSGYTEFYPTRDDFDEARQLSDEDAS